MRTLRSSACFPLIFMLAIALAACEKPAPEAREQPAAVLPELARADTAPGASQARRSVWRLSVDSAGPVPLGLPLGDFAQRFTLVGDTSGGGAGCTYVRLAGAPEGLLFMINEGRVARADVQGGAILTAEGAGIGTSEQRIRTLYPNLIVRPHKYVDGNYLIVEPHAPADTTRRFLFETRDGRVTSFRGGLLPEVQWVEGCS